jgi:ubiquinone/menaquinone biosynthesis C-methylase UbiE
MTGRWGVLERLLFDGSRSWAVSRARGRVVEIGVGTGLNLPLYGPTVDHIVGVELSEGMLALARRRVTDDKLSRVQLRQGDAQALDLPEESADTVVSTFTFCSIPDPGAAARAAYRVLVPGGRSVPAEHGPSRHAVGRALLRAVEPLCLRFSADHLARDPVPYLQGAGFVVDDLERAGRGGIAFRVLAHRPN